jgi:hypothetical protein
MDMLCSLKGKVSVCVLRHRKTRARDISSLLYRLPGQRGVPIQPLQWRNALALLYCSWDVLKTQTRMVPDLVRSSDLDILFQHQMVQSCW